MNIELHKLITSGAHLHTIRKFCRNTLTSVRDEVPNCTGTLSENGLERRRANYLQRARAYIEDAAKHKLILIDDLSLYRDQDSKLQWRCETCDHISLRHLTSPKCEKCNPKSSL
jgi:hypothetical protein